ncbi:MAG: AAA family ATPase [Pseudomonadota bacterium]
MPSRFVLITGCSGGGKSTLLAELASRGHAVVVEPGRRIVAEERAGSGAALPWVDATAFAARALDVARADLARAEGLPGTVFFDRGAIDAASGLAHLTGRSLAEVLGGPSPYARAVFLAPPWPEIFVQDEDRQHGLAEAEAEYARLGVALRALGHTVHDLPKVSVADRARFVLDRLGLD